MSTSPPSVNENSVKDRRAQDWIYGFFLLGVLTGLIGSLFVVWQYHIDTNPQLIGLHFLGFGAGSVLALAMARRLLVRFPIRSLAIASCIVGFLSLLSLSFLVPPVPAVWRMVSLGLVGFAAGGLAASLLHLFEASFARSTVATVHSAGNLFGFGCTAATVVVAITYFSGSVQIETALLSAFPLLFALLFATNKLPAGRQPFRPCKEQEGQRRELRDFHSVAIILFTLLIFLQSGNEFVLAGWLPLFLIHRLGANPVLALLALATYFLALTAGRIVARGLLRMVSHRRFLLSGIVLAITGYLLLSLLASMTGAFVAIILIGFGLAPIYPLLAEILDGRFAYRTSFYNRIFLIGFTGAMSAPWSIGYIHSFLGIRYIMLIPAFGSIAVLILMLLITLEARFTRSKKEETKPHVLTAAAGKH